MMLILVGYRGEKMVKNLGIFKNHRDTMSYVNKNQDKLLAQFTSLKVEEIDEELGNRVVALFVLRFTFLTLEPEDQIELCDPEVKEPEETDVVSQYYKRGV